MKQITSMVNHFLVLSYNLLIAGGTGYLVYYKNASAWLFLLALCFIMNYKEDDK